MKLCYARLRVILIFAPVRRSLALEPPTHLTVRWFHLSNFPMIPPRKAMGEVGNYASVFISRATAGDTGLHLAITLGSLRTAMVSGAPHFLTPASSRGIILCLLGFLTPNLGNIALQNERWNDQGPLQQHHPKWAVAVEGVISMIKADEAEERMPPTFSSPPTPRETPQGFC